MRLNRRDFLRGAGVAKALPLLDKSVAEEPSSVDLRLMYARALRDSKQYPAAARQFHEALKLKPDSRETWNDLGGMLYLLGALEQAEFSGNVTIKDGTDIAAEAPHVVRVDVAAPAGCRAAPAGCTSRDRR